MQSHNFVLSVNFFYINDIMLNTSCISIVELSHEYMHLLAFGHKYGMTTGAASWGFRRETAWLAGGLRYIVGGGGGSG